MARLYVIAGDFVIVGKQPDGDSLRFVPDNGWSAYPFHRSIRITPSDGTAQLRLEGFDAPETHYGSNSQPLGWRARDHLLTLAGFTKVDFTDGGNEVRRATPQTTRGYVFTAGEDTRQRLIAFAGAGDPPVSVGMRNIGARQIERTLNAAMLRDGFGYLMSYTTLEREFHEVFLDLARSARQALLPIWTADETSSFRFTGNDIGEVEPENGALVFPKLFRRLVDYMKFADDSQDVMDWLRAHKNGEENDMVKVAGISVRLSELLVRQNSRLSLQGDLLDMRFVPK
jgi:endonuclease YncB( thermonuclease family)